MWRRRTLAANLRAELAEGWVTVISLKVCCQTDIYLYKLVIKWAKISWTHRCLLRLQVLPALSHMNSFRIPRPLLQELFPLVCVSVLLQSAHTWHTNGPHFLSDSSSQSLPLFLLLFCPPLERDWKIYSNALSLPSVSVRPSWCQILALLHRTWTVNSAQSCYIWTLMMSLIDNQEIWGFGPKSLPSFGDDITNAQQFSFSGGSQ